MSKLIVLLEYCRDETVDNYLPDYAFQRLKRKFGRDPYDLGFVSPETLRDWIANELETVLCPD